MYFSTNDMYDILYRWYAPKLVKIGMIIWWYQWDIITIRYFKHLVDTHWYTTLSNYGRLQKNENVSTVQNTKQRGRVYAKSYKKFISDNF